MANALNVIHPYKWEGLWVFDDQRVGLEKEPFVEGADTIIDEALAVKTRPTLRLQIVIEVNELNYYL